MSKRRLDLLLVQRGIVESRALAQRVVMAGQVRVNDQVELKPSTLVESNARLSLEQGPRFVSRGGEKLHGALDAFQLQVRGLVCADVGSSTGGFTDCLLQAGALKVYSIDVGKGILDWKLRNDPRVVVMEGVNVRYLDKLPELVDLVTMDVSFISLKLLFPVIQNWLNPKNFHLVTLVKPQFEAGRQVVSRSKGVIRDPQVHRQVLLEVIDAARESGFSLLGLIRSPLLGAKGNAEFLALFGSSRTPHPDIDQIVDSVIQE